MRIRLLSEVDNQIDDEDTDGALDLADGVVD